VEGMGGEQTKESFGRILNCSACNLSSASNFSVECAGKNAAGTYVSHVYSLCARKTLNRTKWGSTKSTATKCFL